uniref:Uncharacterized protein n=1 Tax=viral metagenome TaxID=1070528 RepID=A0A6C0HLW8_9ZZZZ
MLKPLITSENLTMSRKLTADKATSLCNCSSKAKAMIPLKPLKPLKQHALSKRQRKTKKATKN